MQTEQRCKRSDGVQTILSSPAVPQSNGVQRISKELWKSKYRWNGEKHPYETFGRVVKGAYQNDLREYAEEALRVLTAWDFCPGGRILAGAGTDKKVTQINCFVMRRVEDSMPGIMEALKESALTQQMGGGIGVDFSTIRPRGALVHSTQSISSGVIPFMRMWNAMCDTIMSSGSRRGAMMATLRCDHPDVEEFVGCKNKPGELTNFNISVLVTDRFMEAVRKDEAWPLVFPASRAAGTELLDMEGWVIYGVTSARQLWEKIVRHTYEYSEPGVIFVDRLNAENNLSYCEMISCVNPCGEQPLPPYGACNLGSVNLANMVLEPFGERAAELNVDWPRIRRAVRVGVRFLDNVIDTTLYPLPQQYREMQEKRRVGLGVMGLGNMLQQLKVVYGSTRSVQVVELVMNFIACEAYKASMGLARERGSFPAFGAGDEFLRGAFPQRLPVVLQEEIKQVGLRNGTLLTIAPTGNTSIFCGNVSSGIEPTFAWFYKRKVLTADGGTEEYYVEERGWRDYCREGKEERERDKLPEYMVTATQLPVEAHLRVQAAAQKWVDSSISKTINCAEGMGFEEFKHVYEMAYEMGLKGCTTYRPSHVRSPILVASDPFDGGTDPACPSGACGL